MEATGWLRGPVIGCGVTATVSVAAAAATGNVFAVKSADLSRSAPLQREQSILASFKSPCVISCLGFDIAPGFGGAPCYNLFLEYAAGGSLSDEIKRCGGCLDEAQIRVRTSEILSGIADLHDAGVVHCDVKPDNVLIGSNGQAKIGDLGCARLISDGDRVVRGSPMYMAPEAVRGEEQGMPADVWALGCAVIEMATGQPPWPDVVDVASGIRRIGFSGDAPTIPDRLSDEAKDFVANCLKTDPLERYTADELLRHPFVGISRHVSTTKDSSWVSPKSTLDLGFWESVEQEPEHEDELSMDAAATVILELAAASNSPNWSWDEDWEVVRSLTQECPAETEVTAGDAAVSEPLIADDMTSTTSGEQFVLSPDKMWNESCDSCQWEDWDYELFCCKLRILQTCNNEDDYRWKFLIASLLGFLNLASCFWSFVLFDFLLYMWDCQMDGSLAPCHIPAIKILGGFLKLIPFLFGGWLTFDHT